jgi:2-iminobutanoate/2-iminopropanoate deaminase
MRKAVTPANGAPPQGPYSPGIVARGVHVYVSGQGPVDPVTGQLLRGTFRQQAELTFRNVGAILQAAGASWSDVAKVNVHLAHLGDFDELNEVYQQFFAPPYPARTTVQSGLNRIAIEVDCIAVLPEAEPGPREDTGCSS